MRLVLVRGLRDGTWLAYPANESDAGQRGWPVAPVPLHLVTDARALDRVIGRWDGAAWWFLEADRRADPVLAERLRAPLQACTPLEALRLPGLTPELRTAYGLAAQAAPRFAWVRDERRLREALGLGGAQLHDFTDRGEDWWVEWATRDGVRHISAVTKRDLTVISAGICLAGRDRDFDLQSLVGVVQRAADDEDW